MPATQREGEDVGSDSLDNEDPRIQERLLRCERDTAGTDLDLSNLGLLDVPPDVFTKFPSLRRLNLRNNKLDALSQDFAQLLSQLVVLNLTGNALTHLPEQFGSLRLLQKLVLADNRLESLPVSFSRLHALEELHLAGNQLSKLDEEIGNQLLKLHTLDVSRNSLLREIPLSFGTTLTLLRVVDLRGNDGMTSVPDRIRRLHERNVICHSRSKRRELISRALRVRTAVGQTMLNAAIVNPTAAAKKGLTK